MTSWRRAYGRFRCISRLTLKLITHRAYTVNNYWPRQSVTVPAIKGMYQKMLQSEMNGKQVVSNAASASVTNGQKNGV